MARSILSPPSRIWSLTASLLTAGRRHQYLYAQLEQAEVRRAAADVDDENMMSPPSRLGSLLRRSAAASCCPASNRTKPVVPPTAWRSPESRPAGRRRASAAEPRHRTRRNGDGDLLSVEPEIRTRCAEAGVPGSTQN